MTTRLNIWCANCNKDYIATYEESEKFEKETEYGKRTFVECALCGKNARVQGKHTNTSFGKPQIHAFFNYKGTDIPVDKKGNIVDNDVYRKDPRGWKRAGYGTQGYERSIVFK